MWEMKIAQDAVIEVENVEENGGRTDFQYTKK